ncbi:MAG: DNA primase [Candidatus Vogelbacteria bacterium]|nr:DNA primase [Candidatus Vogelbacteria bacterium]
MSSTVEQIKAKLNIVDVVGSYLKLDKAGVNYKARCPFHQERTASFFVSPTRESFYCFGCNRGGDIFTFVEEVEGLDFLGALKVLGERAGVPIGREDFKRDDSKEKLFEVLAAAADFYRGELKRSPAAINYLTSRGLKQETIEKFSLGFAPAGWQNLFNFLRERGYAAQTMVEAGLVLASAKRPGEFYDRFRGRIMFPLKDGSGRVIGFSARIFGESEGAKYINSPQTALYDKSRVLYGYAEAKLPIRRADRCVLVEGQMDLLMSHQADVANTVAVSGTALTAAHLELLRRLTNHLVMAFDPDAAGLGAAKRGIALALGLGLEVKLASLPAGADPAELIRTKPEAWPQAVAESKHALDFLLIKAAEKTSDRRELAHVVKREIYPLIAILPERIDQAHFIAAAASLTGLSEEVIRAGLAEISEVRPQEIPEAKPRGSNPRGFASGTGADPSLSRRDRIESKLFGLHWWRPELASERLKELFPEGEKRWQSEKDKLILEAEFSYDGLSNEKLEAEVKDLVASWQEEKRKAGLQELAAKLAQAERVGDTASAEKYIREIKNIYDQKKV